MSEEFSELSDGHRAQVSAFTSTHSDGLRFDFAIPYNQKVRDLEQSMLADFKADFLISQVGLGTEPAFVESFFNILGEFGLLVGDIHDHRLGWREPGRECTFVVLDENSDETLERTEDCTVQHHGMLAAVVFGNEFGAQTDRQVEIELQGTTLPDAAQAIFQRELDLRPVEGTFARLQVVRQAGAVEGGGQCSFGAIPQLIGTDALSGRVESFISMSLKPKSA